LQTHAPSSVQHQDSARPPHPSPTNNPTHVPTTAGTAAATILIVLYHVQSVQLSQCETLTRLDAFQYATSLDISRSRILEDAAFDVFRLLHTLRIQSSTCLRSVAAFSHLMHVSLSLCVQLTHVAPLAYSRTLAISSAPYLDNVDALGTVHELSLSRCADLRSVDGLTHNYIVRLSVRHIYIYKCVVSLYIYIFDRYVTSIYHDINVRSRAHA
jgi:hypothetical protein